MEEEQHHIGDFQIWKPQLVSLLRYKSCYDGQQLSRDDLFVGSSGVCRGERSTQRGAGGEGEKSQEQID